MTTQNPRSVFPEFYDNPVIRDLGHTPRWTVSSNEKAPLDMRELMLTGRIRGAVHADDSCLVTLDELTGFLPNAANHAYYLQGQIDGYLVLDIEPECPPQIAQQLLSLPALYTEVSMSGRGFHLVMPLPANFWDYPIATNKKALKEEHKHYEILVEHWVTFTRRPVHASWMALPPAPDGAWEKLYALLAKDVVETPSAELDIELECPEIPNKAMILKAMTARKINRSPDDFHGDHSRYEFSVLGVLYHRMITVINEFQTVYPTTSYGDSEKVWLLYEAVREVVPPRAKHAERRNGMPLLFDRSMWVLSRKIGEENAGDSPEN